MPKHGPWTKGITNAEPASSRSDTALKDAVNMAITEGGSLVAVRAPQLVADGLYRDAVSCGPHLVLFGDATDVLTGGQTVTVPVRANTATLAPTDLVLTADDGVYALDGLPLAVMSPMPGVALTAGPLSAGLYRVALAASHRGLEQPCFDLALPVEDGEGITLTATTDGWMFCSERDGNELYLVAEVTAGQLVTVPTTPSGRAPLHLNKAPMTGGKYAAWHQGRLWTASGQFVFSSDSYSPGVTDPATMYSAWPADVVGLAAGDGGLFVAADRLYRVTSDGVQVVIDDPVLSLSPVDSDQSFVAVTANGLYLVSGESGRADSWVPDGFAVPHMVQGSGAIAGRHPFNGLVVAVDHDGWPAGIQPPTL